MPKPLKTVKAFFSYRESCVKEKDRLSCILVNKNILDILIRQISYYGFLHVKRVSKMHMHTRTKHGCYLKVFLRFKGIYG